MNVYCVKYRRITPNVPRIEWVVATKNGRKLLKVKSAVYGITKTRFFVWKKPVPGSFGVPNFSPKLVESFVRAAPKQKGPLDILGKALKNCYGTGVDVHKPIRRLTAPARGWTLPGHNQTTQIRP